MQNFHSTLALSAKAQGAYKYHATARFIPVHHRPTTSQPSPFSPLRSRKATSEEAVRSAMAKQAVAMLVALALVVVAAASAGGASAQLCNAAQLAVCAPAVISGAAPSAPCCANLRAQQPCFCQYARNPVYSSYINSPNARRTLTSCGIAIPNC